MILTEKNLRSLHEEIHKLISQFETDERYETIEQKVTDQKLVTNKESVEYVVSLYNSLVEALLYVEDIYLTETNEIYSYNE